jgi:hypothetical protein
MLRRHRLALLLCCEAVLVGQVKQPEYASKTIEAVLAKRSQMDGVRVKMQGEIVLGYETSAFRDSSSCKGLPFRVCAIWLDTANCQVLRRDGISQICSIVLDQLWAGKERSTKTTIVRKATVFGVVYTERRDLHYDQSLPSSVRIGFGHLGGYPAELRVERLVLEASEPPEH